MGVHSVCPHNEHAALRLRVLGQQPAEVYLPLGRLVTRAFDRVRGVAGRYSSGAWSHLETAQSYTGAMRRKYIEAECSLREDGPVTSRDATLKAFLKAEKVSFNKLPKPRLIFPRSARYNLDLASRLKPFEHWLWGNLKASTVFGATNTRVVLKGLSPRQRANLLVRKFRAFDDCVVFEVDGKAFEAHVGPSLLNHEHAVYSRAFPGDRGLDRLLGFQKGMFGRTAGGIAFSREGGRASGDYNTGMGNSIAMLCIVAGTLSFYGVPFDLAVDGDNALIFLERSHYPRVVASFASRVRSWSGMELTLEKPTSVVERIRFGRSAPVFLGRGRGWTMVRDWQSVLAGTGATHLWRSVPGGFAAWMAGVVRCELSLALGVPILQGWALNTLRTMGPTKAVDATVYRDYQAMGAWLAGVEDTTVVTDECRVSFEIAFGVPAEVQRALETSLASGPGTGLDATLSMFDMAVQYSRSALWGSN